MTETTFSANGFVERFYKFPLRTFMTGNYKLGYAVAIGHFEGVGRKIDQYDAYFAPIIGIDSARRIEQRDAML